MSWRFSLVLAGLCALVLSSCGGGAADPGPIRDSSGFKLSVLPDSFVDGGSASGFALSVDDYGQDIVVNVKASQVEGLKALYFSLDYDPEQYRPLTAAPGRNAGLRQDFLSLNVMRERGRLWHGQVLQNYQWKAGMDGDGIVATATFRKQRMPETRVISATTVSNSSATILSFDSGSGTLSWGYYCNGDYNQDGEVNISDLTPLGANFGAIGPFAVDSNRAAIDGDNNSELNISDLTPIGNSFGRKVLGYNIYNSQNQSDAPASGTPGDNGSASTTSALDTVLMADATGSISTDRKQFSYVVSAPVSNDFYWVRPFEGSNEGTRSNIVGGNPAELPHIEILNPPSGGGSGSGTALDPYKVDISTIYNFKVTDKDGNDVSLDSQTTYNVTNSAGSITNANAQLDIDDAFTGAFNVNATYQGIGTVETIFFSVQGGGGGGGLFIFVSPSDGDWTSVTGAGSVADPFVNAVNGGFNSDFTTVFDLVANDQSDGSGNPIDVSGLTWAADPPFIAAFGTPGSFTVNQFTTGDVFAVDGADESNHFTVETHALPST